VASKRPYTEYRELPLGDMVERSDAFAAHLERRRSVRAYSPRPVPRAVLEACLRAAGTAPSGAHLQPWHFAVVESVALKGAIRREAEAQERIFHAAITGYPAGDATVLDQPRKPIAEISSFH
jgi:nitroreductase